MGRAAKRARAWAVALGIVAIALEAGPAKAQDERAEPASGGRETYGDPGAAEPLEDAGTLEAPGRPERGRQRVAVLLLAARKVDPETADALTEVAIGAVAARGGMSILGKEEFQTQLGHGEARSMECVTSSACLGRVGVQLGVDEVIAGTVGRRGGTWVFNLNRIDIRTGEAVGRSFREVDGDLGKVAATIQRAIPELYEPVRERAILRVSANVEGAEVSVDGVLVGIYRGEPVRLDDVSPGFHRVAVSAPDHADWRRSVNVAPGSTLRMEANLEAFVVERRISPLIWVGAGVMAVASMTGLYFGISSQSEHDQGLTRAEALEFVDNRKREARTANIAFGVAAAGAVTAVVGALLSNFRGDVEAPRSSAKLGAVPLERGGMIRVEGALR